MSSCHIEANLSGLQKDHAAYVAMELIKESYAVTLNQKKSQQGICALFFNPSLHMEIQFENLN